MLAHAAPVPIIRSRGEIQLPRAVYTWVHDPARETQVPVNQITDDESAYLRALVERERASTNYHTTRENILLAGIERAIRALRDERDRSTRARMILTMVWQSRSSLPCFDGNYPVLGVWMVDSEACGLGIREDVMPITGNSSRFVPHYLED